MEVLSLLRSKNRCLERFLALSRDFLDRGMALEELDAFETRVAEAEALGQGDDESDLRRLLYGGAMDVQLDAHGRLVLPHTIRKEVGISTEVYWTTGGNYLELWNPERLHAHESVARQETLRTQFAALSRTTVRPDAGPIVRTVAANPDGGEA